MNKQQPKGQGEIVYTVGLPRSGKSTWAKNYVRELQDKGVNVVDIELDEMRQEFGLEPGESHGDKFQRVLNVRKSRIKQYLEKGYVVVLSDTNLTHKATKEIYNFEKEGLARHIKRVDFTHVPLETCIERDLKCKEKGERYVGEGVIRRLYSLIKPNEPIQALNKCLVIGDVHGDYTRLIELLSRVSITRVGGTWLNPNSIFLVFLGDLNDPRLSDEEHNKDSMSSLECIHIARELENKGWACVLQSNHGFNLMNHIKGRRKKLDHGLNHTVEELKDFSQEQLEELVTWLTNLPYFYSFTSKGKKVTCVHAQYTPHMRQYNPIGIHSQAALYGNSTGQKDENGYEIRRAWWEELDFVPPNEVYVSGHYHKVIALPDWYEPRALVLDGNCGCDGGKLLGYLFQEEGENELYVV